MTPLRFSFLLLLTALAACGGPAPNPAGGFEFVVSPAEANVPRGEAGAFALSVTRSGGFASEVSFGLEDPLPGVTGSGVVGAGEREGELLVHVAEDAPLGSALLTVAGRADGATETATLALTVLEAYPPNDSPKPHHVRVTPDESRKTTATVGPAGGTLHATAADGTRFTLDVPPGALLADVELTMTPVMAVADLPLEGGLVGAVRLEPDGLLLLEPARLVIAPAAGMDAGALVAFNSHEGGREFYLQPHDAADGSAVLFLSHFSNPGVGSGDLSGLLEPLVPTDRADRFETNLARDAGRARFYVGSFYLVVRQDLFAARSSPAKLRAALQAFLTWRKEVSRLKLDAEYKAEIYEGWTLVAQGVEHAVDEAAAACADGDLGSLGDILGWISWVKANPRLAPYFEGKLAAFEAKAEGCASFELEFVSELTVRSYLPREGYNAADITSDYRITATVPVRYDAATGLLGGEGELRPERWTTSGYFAHFGPPRDPDCPSVRPGGWNPITPFYVGRDFTGASSLDTLLANLNTGRTVATVDLVLHPGVALQTFKLTCEEGPQEVNGVENHGAWSIHLPQAYGFGGEALSWWRVGGFAFEGEQAEVTLPVRYDGPDPHHEEGRLELSGETRFVLEHTPR